MVQENKKTVGKTTTNKKEGVNIDSLNVNVLVNEIMNLIGRNEKTIIEIDNEINEIELNRTAIKNDAEFNYGKFIGTEIAIETLKTNKLSLIDQVKTLKNILIASTKLSDIQHQLIVSIKSLREDDFKQINEEYTLNGYIDSYLEIIRNHELWLDDYIETELKPSQIKNELLTLIDIWDKSYRAEMRLKYPELNK